MARLRALITRLRSREGRRLLLFVGVIVALWATVALGLPHSPQALRAMAAGAGVLAPIALLAAWTGGTVVLFSGTILAAATGLLLGPWWGTAVSIAGATLGGTAAFLLARRGARGPVESLSGERIRAISARLERRGLLAVLCARAAPGMPATILHYVAGVSRVRLRDFVAGIALGGAPRIFAYTAIGGSIMHPTSPAAIAALAVLVVMTLGGVVVAWRHRRRLRGGPAAA